MEKVRDLFHRTQIYFLQLKICFTNFFFSAASDNLAIHEDKARGVYVKDLREIYVSNTAEVYEAMKNGSSNRVVAYTSKYPFFCKKKKKQKNNTNVRK